MTSEFVKKDLRVMPFATGPAMRQIDAGKELSCALRNRGSGATVVMADGNFLTSQ
jgi:hypothetical protein